MQVSHWQTTTEGPREEHGGNEGNSIIPTLQPPLLGTGPTTKKKKATNHQSPNRAQRPSSSLITFKIPIRAQRPHTGFPRYVLAPVQLSDEPREMKAS